MRLAALIATVAPSAPALLWALLHSLWQAALLAGLCRILLLVVPTRRPNWRYGISLAALVAVVLLFLVTWRVESHVAPQPLPTGLVYDPPTLLVPNPVMAEKPSSTPPSPIPQALIARKTAKAPESQPSWPTALASCWAAGVLLMVLRAGRVLCGESRIARVAQPVQDEQLLTLLDGLRDRLRVVRCVALATVNTACSPAVVGIVSPVILIPTALLTGSSPDHLRAILAHELAHIRRWDVLVNLLQLLAESLLFHNPFVWFLSAQIRHEREACCDALAARCCGGGTAYARVLVDVGQAVLASRASVSFARPGGLADRVRRLLGLRPATDTWRLPPFSLILGLIAGIASVAAIAQGTAKATDAVLSARERTEVIEKAVNQQKEAAEAAIGTTTYIGTIATPDGGLLPKGTKVLLDTSEPHSFTSAGCRVDPKTGQFKIAAKGTTAILWVRVPGYTPWWQGPMKPGPEPVTDTGLWVLEPLTPLVVRVVDERGEPIPDAEVSEHCTPAPNSSFWADSAVTDAVGECVLPLVRDCPVSLDAKAEEFEPARLKDLYPEEGKPVVLSLRRSIPLVLRITDRVSGKPLPGATVRELAHKVPTGGSMTHGFDRAPVLATSAPDGRCAISGLHREGTYWLLVEAEGHGIELVSGATPGEEAMVALGPPRILTGTITGDLGKLQPSGREAEAWVGYGIQMGTRGHRDIYTSVPIRIENGIGTFRIETLYRGSFRVSAGGQTKEVAVADGETTVEFVIPRDGETAVPRREVRFEFEPMAGSPLPRGTMRVSHRDLDDRFYSAEDLPIEDGVVSLRVPVGSSLDYKPGGVIGGWFARGRIDAVPAGDTPLTVGISYIPAGAIAVSLVDGEGQPTDGFMTSVREIEKSPDRQGPFLDIEGKCGSSSGDGVYAFTATPLPLGGTYEIVAYRGCTYVTTGPIRVTEKEPFHKRQLVLEGSATITGQVVGPNGEPVADAPINLGLVLAGSSYGTSDRKTDEDGRFEFTGVVPHPQAGYTVSVSPRQGFVPATAKVEALDRPVRIALSRNLVVTGRIINAADDSPVQGDEMRLWRQTTGIPTGPITFHAEKPTARDGSFRFSNLAPGTYKLHSERARYDAEHPTVTAGQKDPVIWRVAIGH
jgi:beta-lactamase regulating signal transducer with metallopeptidase domain/protocatechuate 3,4-dioxygenase beta subunit